MVVQGWKRCTPTLFALCCDMCAKSLLIFHAVMNTTGLRVGQGAKPLCERIVTAWRERRRGEQARWT